MAIREDKHPMYGISSSEPVEFVCGSQDVKITFNNKKIRHAQLIELSSSKNKPGIMTAILSDETSPFKLLKKSGRLIVTIITGSGYTEDIFDKNIEFYQFDFAVSVDDIVSHIKYYFRLVKENKS